MARETRLAEYESYGEWVRWLADGGEKSIPPQRIETWPFQPASG